MRRRLVVIVVLAIGLCGILVSLPPVSAHAQTGANPSACGQNGFLGFPTWYKYLDPNLVDPDGDGPQPTQCKINFEFPKDVGLILLAFFEIILRIAGVIAVAFLIVGGFQYILSQGEPDRVSGAKSTILNALIGLAIAISATAIVNLIANSIT